MLYQIIPPILIILSLAGIIIFFMKKAPQIAKLDDAERLEKEEMEILATAGFFKQIFIKIKGLQWDSVKHILLVMSDKITRRARIVFLKLESKSRELNDSIRNKRKNRDVKKNISIENIEKDDIIDKVKNYQPGNKKKRWSELKNVSISDDHNDGKAVKASMEAFKPNQEQRAIKPIVSDRVATPKVRVEMKDRLEELLIERIAANPKDMEAYERLGEYYMEIDSLNDAKECFKQVLKLDPKNGNVKYRMRKLETIMRKK